MNAAKAGAVLRAANPATVITEAYAGLQSQAIGLAEASGFLPTVVPIVPRAPWRWVSARFWPDPLRAVGWPALGDDVLFSAGGTAAVVAAARKPRGRLVQVQHPRFDVRRFDVVVVNRHDGLTGPNIVVTRTALHGVTQARLAAARTAWQPVFAHLPRPLVAVLVGGSNGRFRLDAAVAAALGQNLAEMMRRDGAGVAMTPSRRTSPEVQAVFAVALGPLGAWLWDGTGANPYHGLLACADAIVVTEDSVSMVSEAVATSAPVLLAPLPGTSKRIRLFTRLLVEDGRVRPFAGRFEAWPVQPLDDTAMAGAEVRRRLGLPGSP